MSIKGFITGNSSSESTSAGLLILRVLAGLSLFLKHGLEKLTGYPRMVQHFPNPIHIGAHATLAYALLSDGICSVLVILGLATRPAAIVIVINMLTVFFLVQHAAFFSRGNGELVWLYIVVFLTLIFTGPGRISIDARFRR